jgi:hypothetical protein
MRNFLEEPAMDSTVDQFAILKLLADLSFNDVFKLESLCAIFD